MPRIFRGVVLLLVLLAASPLTTPYATCDLLDLFGDSDSGSETAVKVPSPKEFPVLAATMSAVAVAGDRPADTVSRPEIPSHRPQLSRPLRL